MLAPGQVGGHLLPGHQVHLLQQGVGHERHPSNPTTRYVCLGFDEDVIYGCRSKKPPSSCITWTINRGSMRCFEYGIYHAFMNDGKGNKQGTLSASFIFINFKDLRLGPLKVCSFLPEYLPYPISGVFLYSCITMPRGRKQFANATNDNQIE